MAKLARNYHAQLTLKSANAKTGKIPVSVTASDSCPPTCSFMGNGCYAESGPLALHWSKVNTGERGMPWQMFCDAIDTLPANQLWRHNAAGDLPGHDGVIDGVALGMLVKANAGKRGFTYTHYPPTPGNVSAVAMANAAGFTVNFSADSASEADALCDLGVGPVVCVLPSTQTTNSKTPAGRTVVVCPATVRDDTRCADCGLCQVQRDTVIGFPAHGSSYRKVDTRLLFKTRVA